MLDMLELSRDASFINKQLSIQKNHSVYSNKEVSVLIPKCFLDTPLLDLGERYYCLGCLMIKIGNKYAVLSAMAMLELGKQHHSIVEVKSEGGVIDECLEFKYSEGELIFESLEILVDNTLPYDISYKIIKLGGQIPFFNKNDFETMFDSVPYFCNLHLPQYAYMNIYISVTCRNPKDKTIPARLSKDPSKHIAVPFNSVIHSTTNTLSKLSGPHMETGMQSALINKNAKASTLEEVLRS